ncbi:MAG: D-glycero-alpha-D-manno-heptose-1,7-bisphosphate 7-phosphatase [Thermodesulfobacteriota bacterium]
MPSKAVFFDRDKTIIMPNADNYIYRVGDFYIPEKFTKALKTLYEKGYKLFVVTNQGRVAKGYMTEEDVVDVHNFINDHFKEHGFHFEQFAYCPHNPMGDVYPYNVVCSCRKPKNGMIKELVDEYDIDISKSWMVGDTERDVIAGNMTGLKTILVRTGIRQDSEKADFVVDDLVDAVEKIVENDAVK